MQKREGHLNNGFIKEPPRRIPCPALPCDAMIETDEVDGQHFARGNLFRADEATDRPLSLFLAKRAPRSVSYTDGVQQEWHHYGEGPGKDELVLKS